MINRAWALNPLPRCPAHHRVVPGPEPSTSLRDAQSDDPVGVAPEDILAHFGGDVSLVPPAPEPFDMLEI